jgi:transposase InsO family protein
MPDADLLEAIRQALADSPFHGEGYRKVWARLRHRGPLHLEGAGAPADAGERPGCGDPAQAAPRPAQPRRHDHPRDARHHVGNRHDSAFTAEYGQVAMFVAVDHCSAECVGIHAALPATRHEALEPVRQDVAERFGGIGKDAASGLAIRHDHGSQYMSRDFQKEIAWLGAASSPAFVRAPEGNGCAERFIRTLKENLLWVKTFRTVEELRLALIDFRRTYNEG